MLKKIITTSLASCVAVAVMSGANAQTSDDKYGMIVIDRSGSMLTRRFDGQTRCNYANDLAIEKAEKWFTPEGQQTSLDEDGKGGTHLDIRTFDSPGDLVSLGGGYVTSFSEAETYIRSLGGACSGSTALKEAACLSLDDIANTTSGNAREIYFIADAGENSSASTDCSTDTGSWQTDVFNHWFQYFFNPGVQFNYTQLVTGNVSFSRASNTLEAEPSSSKDSQLVTINNSIMSSAQLWSSLATLSGGEYVIDYDDGTVEIVVGESDYNPW